MLYIIYAWLNIQMPIGLLEMVFSLIPVHLAVMSFITHEVRLRFLYALFLCKGTEAFVHAKYLSQWSLFLAKIWQQPSTDSSSLSGYSAKFSPKFLGFRPMIASLRVPQRKGTKSETKSMTTDKEKTHGRLDKNLKNRDLSSLSR